MSFTVVIPARAASTRLPRKPLLDIGGVPMVIRTAQQAVKSQADKVVIATDSQEIATLGDKFGFETIITSADHPTGTDRLSEVVEILKLDGEDIIVNVQGDEPFIEPDLINQVAQLLVQHDEAAITTCASPIHKPQILFDPNSVKVVCDKNSKALYFSRAPIPWARDALAKEDHVLATGLPAWQHIGLYAYRAHFLRKFPLLETGTLERYESLEQLRAMEHGYQIFVYFSQFEPNKGIDTPEDLALARAKFDSD